MLSTRIVTAIIGIPLLLAIIYFGSWYAQLFFLILGILAVGEFHSIISSLGHKPFRITPYLLFSLIYFEPQLSVHMGIAVFLVLMLLIIEFTFRYPEHSFIDFALSTIGPLYVGFLLSYANRTIMLDCSFQLLLLTFLITWSNDSGGYFVGRKFGKHKLAPVLSPKKTWEGFIGGLVFVIAIVLFYFKVYPFLAADYYVILALAVIGACFAQLGDLMMSGLKRTFKVKDSGRLIPGHGGILDRFDSFLIVLPTVYFFFMMLNHNQ